MTKHPTTFNVTTDVSRTRDIAPLGPEIHARQRFTPAERDNTSAPALYCLACPDPSPHPGLRCGEIPRSSARQKPRHQDDISVSGGNPTVATCREPTGIA